MILAGVELRKALKSGRIKITPFNERLVGACSVDLRLGNEFRKASKRLKKVRVDERFGYGDEYGKVFSIPKGKGIEIKPFELVLGTTLERIRLGDDVCGRLEGRSTLARIGLFVHVSCSLVQPGVDNVQILEILNASPQPIVLYPGARICQIVFEELKGRAVYTGRFRKQTKP